ncbi:hypothetical protein I6H88_14405 [Elizabethkingia bruuniana]|uniref:Uncharacterized protein n=1 Tax=Elizabethkingia bruuniana TaxID=1756149 RepID=A0A7T7UWR0_9FLAO|nr:hypothetical protein [Elizabethkingia bruuniana]KGO10171.1 hypothetical protein KS04_10590 [Elizabethkingia miricola]AQX84136.1 hypothetical protein AYC65_03470 [Elizabethkingia bruuniana]KUY28313.1 hypothetical protein ATB97_15465 [Elizabethkingia bruuniana]OPB64554.1 hypothetical protein BAY12_07110 [Elizabethkingia bruuniana]QDZ63153.1 hypothetical protein EVD20_11565 [Elizabethkingia bruuniana]
MNKFIIYLILIILTMLPVSYAQYNPFIKTTWKIDHIAPNGKAILVKAKWINLSKERAKFHFIQFEDNFNYQTGISCYNALGLYRVRENNIIELSTSDGAMSPDCEEPKILSGSYYFKENNNIVELTPLYEETPSTIDAIATKSNPPEAKGFPAKETKQKIKKRPKYKKIIR